MRQYHMTTLNPMFDGIINVGETEDKYDVAEGKLEDWGYSDWCEEEGYLSYDFELEEVSK